MLTYLCSYRTIFVGTAPLELDVKNRIDLSDDNNKGISNWNGVWQRSLFEPDSDKVSFNDEKIGHHHRSQGLHGQDFRLFHSQKLDTKESPNVIYLGLFSSSLGVLWIYDQ